MAGTPRLMDPRCGNTLFRLFHQQDEGKNADGAGTFSRLSRLIWSTQRTQGTVFPIRKYTFYLIYFPAVNY